VHYGGTISSTPKLNKSGRKVRKMEIVIKITVEETAKKVAEQLCNPDTFRVGKYIEENAKQILKKASESKEFCQELIARGVIDFMTRK